MKREYIYFMPNGDLFKSKYFSDGRHVDSDYVYSTMTNTWYGAVDGVHRIEISERFVPTKYKAKLLLLI